MSYLKRQIIYDPINYEPIIYKSYSNFIFRYESSFPTNIFYIGNELLDYKNESSFIPNIKLHKFRISFLKDYEFTPPDLTDDEEPYIYLPYQEKFSDQLDKFGKDFNIYNSFYTYSFLESFRQLMYNQVKKWNKKYNNYEIGYLNKFFYSLMPSKYTTIDSISRRLIEKNYNLYKSFRPIEKILESKSKCKENITVKIHMSIKPEYIFYVCEMIIKHYDKFIIHDDLSEKEITLFKNYVSDFETEIPEILSMKNSYLYHFKFIPNFNLSNLSPAFKRHNNILPSFVFYPTCSSYANKIINILKEIFNERITNIIHINKAPRYNFRINKMIYIGYGDGDYKPGTKLEDGKKTLYDQPEEYYRLEEKCKTKLNKEDCLKINEFSQNYSDNDICSFDEQDGICKISKDEKRYNLVLVDSSFKSLKNIYNEIEPKPARIEDYEQKYKKYKMKYLALRKKLHFMDMVNH